jgi:hypothetical protein
VLCDAFPISDLTSLELYSSKGCTVVAGDLYVINLPFSITLAVLFEHLHTIQYIRGSLYIKDSPWITSLFPLRNLLGVQGLFLSSMANIVDARIPGLQQLHNEVHVEHCNRLCPARYTAVGAASLDDSGCPYLTLKVFIHVEGNLPAVLVLGAWQGLIANALQNISGNTVSLLFSRLPIVS